MALTHIIAHRIQRSSPNSPSTSQIRDTCWSINGRVDECFRELKHTVIKRIGKEYGRFSDDHGNHPLSSWLNQYHEAKMSFESFSHNTMKHLHSEIDKTEEVIDGFIIFAHETLESDELLHIFFAQHNSAQYIDGDMDLNESFYLDTSAVRLAAKINISDWKSDDPQRSTNVVTLLRWRGEKELTDIFERYIGFAEKIDLTADTQAFLEVVNEYTKELPDDVAHHTKTQVVNYCLEQDKIGKPVVMSELSTQLKDNPAPKTAPKENHEENNTNRSQSLHETPAKPTQTVPEFASFVNKQRPSAKPELIPDKSQLRQFVRISGRNDQLSMSFASSCLGDTIFYDPTADSITIKNIPAALKSRLAKHFIENK